MPEARSKVSAFKRFFSIGFADADARLGYALAPRSFAAADRYLASSTLVRVVDRATRYLRDWSLASATGQAMQSLWSDWRRQDWQSRYEAAATTLLTAVSVHVVLTLANGPRPGWFWLIVPGMAAALAIVVLAGSRRSSSH